MISGRQITDEINADPAEIARLRKARQQARDMLACPVAITYDPEIRAAYVYLGGMGGSVRTQQLSDSVLADYDAGGRVIGVELLGVQQPYLARDAEDAEKRLIARRRWPEHGDEEGAHDS